MVIPEVEEQLKQLKVENVVLMGIEVFEKQLNKCKKITLAINQCKLNYGWNNLMFSFVLYSL